MKRVTRNQGRRDPLQTQLDDDIDRLEVDTAPQHIELNDNASNAILEQQQLQDDQEQQQQHPAGDAVEVVAGKEHYAGKKWTEEENCELVAYALHYGVHHEGLLGITPWNRASEKGVCAERSANALLQQYKRLKKTPDVLEVLKRKVLAGVAEEEAVEDAGQKESEFVTEADLVSLQWLKEDNVRQSQAVREDVIERWRKMWSKIEKSLDQYPAPSKDELNRFCEQCKRAAKKYGVAMNDVNQALLLNDGQWNESMRELERRKRRRTQK
mmetsp:Transcript_13208/g.23734  ORF Transcript_13208/g.23734 Transcript_13208/m.23734 type:complete len:269 (-) Transcript_13208:104-910(-)